MKKLTDFSFCKFLFVLGFTTLLVACSEESTDKVNNVINSSSIKEQVQITPKVQQEINKFEETYFKQMNVTDNSVTMVGYRTMPLSGKNKEVVKWQFEKYKKEIEKSKGIFIASDFSFYRIYFPMHTAIVDINGKEYKANEVGSIRGMQLTRATPSSIAIIGRVKSEKVAGCSKNIILPNKILLKSKLIPTENKKGFYVFDLGIIECCQKETRGARSTPCTQNHPGYANCSDAFQLWGGNCVQRRDVCMDFNGWGSDCVKGPKTYFLGSDCQKAMTLGHCWNEYM